MKRPLASRQGLGLEASGAGHLAKRPLSSRQGLALATGASAARADTGAEASPRLAAANPATIGAGSTIAFRHHAAEGVGRSLLDQEGLGFREFHGLS